MTSPNIRLGAEWSFMDHGFAESAHHDAFQSCSD